MFSGTLGKSLINVYLEVVVVDFLDSVFKIFELREEVVFVLFLEFSNLVIVGIMWGVSLVCWFLFIWDCVANILV